VADHRRHHKYSDKEGDPHSPWKYGDDAKALAKGLLWAHVLCCSTEPDLAGEVRARLLADRKIRLVDNWFPGIVAFSLLVPRWPAASGPPPASGPGTAPSSVLLAGWSASRCCTRDLVDQLDLPHLGNTDWQSRDRSVNVSWLAIASFGESWHNCTTPTDLRPHGALKGRSTSPPG